MAASKLLLFQLHAGAIYRLADHSTAALSQCNYITVQLL